jgi:beta-lactamase superfamily II metal-dependent hydrolase
MAATNFTYLTDGISVQDKTSIPTAILHVFRVEEGLGNACLIQLPDRSWGVVDWGTQKEGPLERALDLIGKSRIRFVAASHAHSDHTLGIARFLSQCVKRNIKVEKFVYPATTLHKQAHHLTRAREIAFEHGIEMYSIAEDSFLGPPGKRQPPWLAYADDLSWEVRVLSPSLISVADAEITSLYRDGAPGNETSLVLLFRFPGSDGKQGFGSILLPGDATAATLRYARETSRRFPELSLDNQLFLVPHHGSRRNSPKWVDKYLHGIVVVSAPTDSSHHPSESLLKRFASRAHKSEQLFCTSYAHACRESFRHLSSQQNRDVVQPGACFGDIAIAVSPSEAAQSLGSSHDGSRRREFGHCTKFPAASV